MWLNPLLVPDSDNFLCLKNCMHTIIDIILAIIQDQVGWDSGQLDLVVGNPAYRKGVGVG